MKTMRSPRQRRDIPLAGSIKFSISIPAQLASEAIKRQAALRFGPFSDYVQHAIRKELGIGL